MTTISQPWMQIETRRAAPISASVSIASVLGILLGLGGASLMPEDSTWRWLLGLGGGLLAAGAALAFLLWPVLKTGIPGLLQRSRAALAALWTRAPSIKFQRRFPWLSIARREAAAATAPAEERPAIRNRQPLPWDVWQGLLIGASLLLPALIVRLLGLHSHGSGNLLVIYFSTPAILLWAGGQAASLYPHWMVRPKHLPQISGLLGGGMQLLGALLLWVHLGMDSGIEVSTWMFWLSAALAVGGVFFNFISRSAQTAITPGM
jgi:MFS family permease